MTVGALDVVRAFAACAKAAGAPGYADRKCRAVIGWHAQALADDGYDLGFLLAALRRNGHDIEYLGRWLSKAIRDRERSRTEGYKPKPRKAAPPEPPVRVPRPARTDDTGDRAYPMDASGIVAAWVDCCRDAKLPEFTDRRTREIIGLHAKRLLAKGVEPATLLTALEGKQRSNPAFLAEWVRRALTDTEVEAHERRKGDREGAEQTMRVVRAILAGRYKAG